MMMDASWRAELRRLREEHRELRRMVWDARLSYAVCRAFDAKYRPDQPRVPAGSPQGGQWVGDGGLSTEVSGAKKLPPIVKEFGKWTARKYASQFCRGLTNRKLPGQFEDMTIEDIWNIAKGGDARARTCLKLLNRNRFHK